MQKFQRRYPHASLRFWDAAVGGQGSQLGIFRLDRDVLSRQPNLLFLEYAVNDGPSETDEERLSSFEAIVRRTLQEARCPVVISILAIREDIVGTPLMRARHAAHQAVAKAYNCALADTVPHMRGKVESGQVQIDDLWANPNWSNPNDVTHPGNLGYELYAQAIWNAYEDAVQGKKVCRLPEQMLHADTYLKTSRTSLATLTAPAGWKKGQPHRVSVAYDFLMSRWLDDLLISQQDLNGPVPMPLSIQFQGAMALLFGESTPNSGKFRVSIDGKPFSCRDHSEMAEIFNVATELPGNCPLAIVLAEGLDPTQVHTLRIEPLLETGQELRFESLCVAGAPARIIPDLNA